MDPKPELSPAAMDWCKEIGADSVKTIDDIVQDKTSKAFALCTRAIQQGIDSANEKAISNAQKIQKSVQNPLPVVHAGDARGVVYLGGNEA